MPPPLSDQLIALMRKSSCYLEYGTGGSTVKAVKLGIPVILAVESDAIWLEAVRNKIDKLISGSRYQLMHVDIGPTGAGGYPVSEADWKNYWRYPLEVWESCWSKNLVPDLVLVDGRFRVACFLASILFGQAGCRILVDDYFDRPYYTQVERFTLPVRRIDRAAEFIVPAELPRDFVWTALFSALGDSR
jgi:hypothetical protein